MSRDVIVSAQETEISQDKEVFQEKPLSTSRNPVKSLRTRWGAYTKICGKKPNCKNPIIDV